MPASVNQPGAQALLNDTDGPSTGGEMVTPSDSANLSRYCRALHIGGAGDVALITLDGSALTYKSLPAGCRLDVACLQVKAAGTTATDIVAMY